MSEDDAEYLARFCGEKPAGQTDKEYALGCALTAHTIARVALWASGEATPESTGWLQNFWEYCSDKHRLAKAAGE